MAKQTKLKDHLEQYDYQTRLNAHNNEAQEGINAFKWNAVSLYFIGLLSLVLIISAMLKVF